MNTDHEPILHNGIRLWRKPTRHGNPKLQPYLYSCDRKYWWASPETAIGVHHKMQQR